MDLTRFFDILFATMGIILLSPVFLVLALIIALTSKGPIIFKQVRVGRYNKDFRLYKFRSMFINAEQKGQLTVGGRDSRITWIGYYLRKFKMDELPQLFNVLKGEMSLVGPRPEVRKYVDYYTPEQQQVLSVLPGITDYASIAYRNENEILANAANPEQTYIQEILPHKIELNMRYIRNKTVGNYFSIIFNTIVTSIKGR